MQGRYMMQLGLDGGLNMQLGCVASGLIRAGSSFRDCMCWPHGASGASVLLLGLRTRAESS